MMNSQESAPANELSSNIAKANLNLAIHSFLVEAKIAVATMQVKHKQYPSPVKEVASTAARITTSIAFSPARRSLSLMEFAKNTTNLVNNALRAALKFIIKDHSVELADYKEAHFDDIKADYIAMIRKINLFRQYSNLSTTSLGVLSDEELFAEMISACQKQNEFSPEEAREHVEQEIMAEHYRGWVGLKLTGRAVSNSFSKFFNEMQHNDVQSNLKTALLLPLQASAAGISMLVSSLFQLVYFSSFAVSTILGAAYTAVSMGALAVINAPLYAIDFGRYLTNQIKKLFSAGEEPNSEVTEGTEQEQFNNGPRHLSELSEHKTASPARTTPPNTPTEGNLNQNQVAQVFNFDEWAMKHASDEVETSRAASSSNGSLKEPLSELLLSQPQDGQEPANGSPVVKSRSASNTSLKDLLSAPELVFSQPQDGQEPANGSPVVKSRSASNTSLKDLSSAPELVSSQPQDGQEPANGSPVVKSRSASNASLSSLLSVPERVLSQQPDGQEQANGSPVVKSRSSSSASIAALKGLSLVAAPTSSQEQCAIQEEHTSSITRTSSV